MAEKERYSMKMTKIENEVILVLNSRVAWSKATEKGSF